MTLSSFFIHLLFVNPSLVLLLLEVLCVLYRLCLSSNKAGPSGIYIKADQGPPDILQPPKAQKKWVGLVEHVAAF